MRSSTRSELSRPDAGQATVELALSLPLVFLVLLGVVQVGLVVRDQLLVERVRPAWFRVVLKARPRTGCHRRLPAARP